MSTDADLIYSACLRTERRLEERINNLAANPDTALLLQANLTTIQTLREEIGTGLAQEGRRNTK